MSNKLPQVAYAANQKGPDDWRIVTVSNGDSGYRDIAEHLDAGARIKTELRAKAVARLMNANLGVTPAQASALKYGTMFGWKSPGSSPDSYDESGILKPRKKSAGPRAKKKKVPLGNRPIK